MGYKLFYSYITFVSSGEDSESLGYLPVKKTPLSETLQSELLY